MTIRYKLIAAAATAGPLAAGLGQSASAELKRISIGTNKAGTTYFVLGGGFAKLFQEKLGIRANAQPHAGSSVYIPLLDQGEIALGINSSIDSALARKGGKPYPRPMTKLQALARIWVLPYGYFVRANSGIKTVEDLKGKKVVIDLKANVSLAAFNWAIMATGGLDKNSLQPIAVGGIGQGLNAVVEGRADAAPIALGIPLGLYSGLKPDSPFSKLIMTGSIVGFSLPTFWVGIMLLLATFGLNVVAQRVLKTYQR